MVNPKTFGLIAFVGLIVSTSPLRAIVDASGSTSSTDISYGQIVDGINFGGVVEISATVGGNTYGCSGSLLSDGVSILTAGHCLDTSVGNATAAGVTVYFQGPSGMVAVSVSNVQVDPSYNGDSTQGNDLAVLTLSQQAPSFAVGYSLFTSSLIPSTPVILAGYGFGGTGDDGYTTSIGTLRAGTNEYEGNGQTLFGYSSSLLIGQFYDASTPSSNGLHVAHPYSASDEVDIAPGDSGGPTFYDGEIIGVHDLLICTSPPNSSSCSVPPAENASLSSYFGDQFADTSVDANLTFIEDAMAPEPGTVALFFGGLVVLIGTGARRGFFGPGLFRLGFLHVRSDR